MFGVQLEGTCKDQRDLDWCMKRIPEPVSSYGNCVRNNTPCFLDQETYILHLERKLGGELLGIGEVRLLDGVATYVEHRLQSSR